MRIKIFFFAFVAALLFLRGTAPEQHKQTATYHFGISLTRSYQSGMITYAILTVNKGKIVGKKMLTRDKFVQMIVGRIPNSANVERKNLFVQNDLDTCVVYVGDIQNKYKGHICPPLDELWKIKYKEHPVKKDLKEGWSQGYYSPSMPQLAFLKKEFGVYSTTQFFWGENLWKLLRKVMDPVWTQKYKNIEGKKGRKPKKSSKSPKADTLKTNNNH